MKQIILSVAGAALGGVLGYFAFFWIYSHGYYGMILPGGLLAIGAGLGKTRSVWWAVAVGIAALALGLFTEWRRAPFEKDDGLSYFILHAHHLNSVTLMMIAVGGALGFWIPFRRVEAKPPTN